MRRTFSSGGWPAQTPERCHSLFGEVQNRLGGCVGLPSRSAEQRGRSLHRFSRTNIGVGRMVMIFTTVGV